MPVEARKQLVVGVTGASGALYARRLLDCLDAAGCDVHLVVSPKGKLLFSEELGVSPFSVESALGRPSERVTLYPYQDIGARIASGSFRTSGMIVCPCSSHSLGGIAAGLGDNLIFRAAEVTLKECRRLVLVTREMPMSAIQLENALRLSRAGAVICPAAPGFYMMPRSIDDLVDFVVGKVLDLVDVPHELHTRWRGHGEGLED
jgi:4-hydroxy-3-polyprenylbenzoate decarboxylase